MEEVEVLIENGQLADAVECLQNIVQIKVEVGKSLLTKSLRYYERYIQLCHQDESISKKEFVKLPVVAQSESRFQVLKMIQILMKLGVNPNYELESGTLLMIAVSTRDMSVLETLLSNGADPNLFCRRQDMNAFALSIIINDVAIVEIFLNNGAYVNQACCGCMTPLQLSMNKCVEISKLLLQKGADIQQVLNISGMNQVQLADPPLIQAVRSGNPYLTSLLLDCGEDINQVHGQREDTAFHIAIKQSNVELVDILIKHGANLDKENARGHTPVGLALLVMDTKQTDIVRMILDAGCSRTKTTSIALFQKAYPPLFVACFLGNMDIVKYLLEDDTTMDLDCDKMCTCEPDTSVHSLTFRGDFEYFQQIASIETDQRGDDLTKQMDQLQMINQNHPKNIPKKSKNCPHKISKLANLVASDGSSPLMLATFGGKVQLVEYLLDVGADYTISNKHGNLVHAAVVSTGSIRFLDIVVNLGCDINMISNAGNSPLLLASRINKPEMCLYLINKGALLNQKDRFGETALSASIYFGCEENARLLIQHGADLDISDSSGTTAFYWSVFNYREKIIRCLIKAGVYFTPEHLAKYPRNLKFMKNKPLIDWIKSHITNPKSLKKLSMIATRKSLSISNSGKSIFNSINVLPLPTSVKDSLKMWDL